MQHAYIKRFISSTILTKHYVNENSKDEVVIKMEIQDGTENF